MEAVAKSCYGFFKYRIFLILWISLTVYLFYATFIFYKNGRQFYHLRSILGIGLCVSRGTAAVLNLCSAIILLPLCKKLNQVLYRVLSKVWPGIFFFWLESAKSAHMTVGITLLVFAVVHSISHFVNLWNFSKSYDENNFLINVATYEVESPLLLLFSTTGLTGITMLVIIAAMGMTSMRIVRRHTYNVFWFTHQLYGLFLFLLIIHPLSGILKEEVLDTHDDSTKSNDFRSPKFVPIQSKTWLWMVVPLTCFFIDVLWRILSRNRTRVQILNVTHLPGRVMCLTLSCDDHFSCGMGQYVLLQCLEISLLEWHPFTVVKLPTSSQREFEVWIRVKGDWTENLEKLLLEKGSHGISVLVDGPFSSPMEWISRSDVAICVAAGIGITPFVSVLHDMLLNPRNKHPARIHLIWIVRDEQEITWLADLADRTIHELRNSNQPDRLHLEFYVTNSKKNIKSFSHIVLVNEKGDLSHKIIKDDERATLLTPNLKRHAGKIVTNKISLNGVNHYDLAKQYPILKCRVRKGRPHWDIVFGYWVNLYPDTHLKVFCCGPKKLVKLLRYRCKHTSIVTKTKFTFIHEGFS